MSKPHSASKQPDEFVSLIDKIVDYSRTRTANLLFVLAVVLFVICATWFWRFYHDSQERKMAVQFYEIKSKSPEEQKEFYKGLLKRYRYAPLGIWVSLDLSNLQADNCEAVTQTLEDYVGHGESAALRALTYLKMGTCLEQLKKYDQAASVYEQGASDSSNPLKDLSRLRLAYVLKSQNRREESQKIFKELSQKESDAIPLVKDQAEQALLAYDFYNNVAESAPETSPESQVK